MSIADTYCALSGLAFFVSLPPLAWHIKNHNVAPTLVIIDIMIINLSAFLNSIIWGHGELATEWNGAVFCDLQVKVLIFAIIGELGATVAMTRNLAIIMSDHTVVRPTSAMKRRRLTIDLLISLTVPVVVMALHYIVQPGRYFLEGIVGCTILVDRTWLSVPLFYVWQPIFSLVGAYYAILVCTRFYRKRKVFRTVIRNNANISAARFARLLLLSLSIIGVYLPVNIYIFVINMQVVLTDPIAYSWSGAHGPTWGEIVLVPNSTVFPTDWIPPVFGFILFGFFGMGTDAMRMYKTTFHTLRARVIHGYWCLRGGKARRIHSADMNDMYSLDPSTPPLTPTTPPSKMDVNPSTPKDKAYYSASPKAYYPTSPPASREWTSFMGDERGRGIYVERHVEQRFESI